MSVVPTYRRPGRDNQYRKKLGTASCSTCGYRADVMSADPDADPWTILSELFLADLNGCPMCPGSLDLEAVTAFVDEPSPPPWGAAGPAGST